MIREVTKTATMCLSPQEVGIHGIAKLQLVVHPDSPRESLMQFMEPLSAWSRALRDPSLHDLPYKIETNEYGQLVMSPTKVAHARIQARIAVLLDELVGRSGGGAVEIGVVTPKGIKVPDVAWMSEERWQSIARDAEASPIAPEICIEILSESNTHAEMDEKQRLYFECGAEEFWTCDLHGRIRFFVLSGELDASALVPAFPGEIEV